MSLTYNQLVSAIMARIEDDGSETVVEIPQIIENACLTIAKEVDAIGLNAIVSVTCDAGNPQVSIPDKCYVIKTLAKVSLGQKKFLKHRAYDYLVEYWPDYASVGGNPSYYNRLNDSIVYVAPTPTSTQQLEVRMVTVSIPNSTDGSYLLTRYPNLLLWRCMVEANLLKMNPEDAKVWSDLYDRERTAVENEARRNRRDDGFTPVQGAQSQDTLKGDK